VSNQPAVHVVVASKLPEQPHQLVDVLVLLEVRSSGGVQLVVWINDQAVDAVPKATR